MDLAFQIFAYTVLTISMLISLAGVAGAVHCMTTREDAFDVAGRRQKWVWVGLLVGSTLATFLNIPFLSWAGIVIIGIYWFDVHPQIRDILRGNF